ncbi:hypothetical protein CFB3_07430 [Clostridium folliculivorans]|nr:hypothetical protein CFB3_07430 [Clostridium folliculivorans]
MKFLGSIVFYQQITYILIFFVVTILIGSLVRGIWFDIDDMVVGMLGVLVGYFIYQTK